MTLGGNGDPAMQIGVAIHLYAANASMEDRFFYSADGELLIVPQLGALRFHTELGILEVEARRDLRDSARRQVPRRARREAGARIHLRELRPAVSPAGTWARSAPTGWRMRATSRRRWPRMRIAMASFTSRRNSWASLWSAAIDHSPLDVVAWHGNYAPYKYDLALFNCINTVSFDHPDPSIYTVLSFAVGDSGNRQLRLCDLSAALDGGGAHLPAAVVSSQPDE